MDTIFPESGEIDMVVGVSMPETTAREEAITVIGELSWMLRDAWLGKEDGGVGYGCKGPDGVSVAMSGDLWVGRRCVTN